MSLLVEKRRCLAGSCIAARVPQRTAWQHWPHASADCGSDASRRQSETSLLSPPLLWRCSRRRRRRAAAGSLPPSLRPAGCVLHTALNGRPGETEREHGRSKGRNAGPNPHLKLRWLWILRRGKGRGKKSWSRLCSDGEPLQTAVQLTR